MIRYGKHPEVFEREITPHEARIMVIGRPTGVTRGRRRRHHGHHQRGRQRPLREPQVQALPTQFHGHRGRLQVEGGHGSIQISRAFDGRIKQRYLIKEIYIKRGEFILKKKKY